jgi:uncharacterized membrane protein YgdD (TMEM256/DUF423 family)
LDSLFGRAVEGDETMQPGRWACCARSWVGVGAALAGLGVAAGAFGAHGLDGYFADKYAEVEPKQIAGFEVPASYKHLEDFRTGVTYQMYHALGLIAVGLLSRVRPQVWLQVAAWAFLLGTVLFSGSLYAFTLTGQRGWVVVTPIGGVLFLIGWLAFAIAACLCGGGTASDE